MRIRRDIASIPIRSAAETWTAIIDLVTGPGTIDRVQLDAARSIMESLIADEHPAKAPIVFKGAGPRLLIYCAYNEDAMEAGLPVDKLESNPTAGDWLATAPCEEADAAWMNDTLRAKAPRIAVHDVQEAPPEDDENQQSAKAIAIDWGALDKP